MDDRAMVTASLPRLPKCPSGISGLDDVTGGGLPRHRLTLVCGGAGCGKTLFALEFVVRGAIEFGEPGVVVSFDETAEELAQNVASIGFDLPTLIAEGKLVVVHILIDPDEQVTGQFDLEPLFQRLENAIKKVDAKRMALDTLEAMFGHNLTEGILRARYRESTTGPAKPIVPGTIYEYKIDLWSTSNVFLKGHRIRLEVSSSNFPRFDRNLNTGKDAATDAAFVKATNTVYHDAAHPSALVLPVVPR